MYQLYAHKLQFESTVRAKTVSFDFFVFRNFKISVNGTLVHSKKSNDGDQFMETDQEQKKVFDAIQAALDE